MHEYPKWVVPHDSHVVRHGDHISTPHFADINVGRDSVVTVLVHDAEQEELALSGPAPAHDPPAQEETE